MFKHILVPSDGSEFSQAAVEKAVAFAKETGARITAFYAKPSPPIPYYGEGIGANWQMPASYTELVDRQASGPQDGAAAGEDAAKIGGRHDAEPAVDKALVAVLKTIDLDRFFAIGHERLDNAAHGGVERLAVAATGKKTDPKHDESFRASYNMRISLPPHTVDTGVKRVSSSV